MFDSNPLPLSLFLQAERQARLDSLVIKACMRGTMSRLAEWLRALGTWGTGLARDLADERLLRNAIRELHQLDDRTLASASRGVGSNSPCARGGSRDSFRGGNARKLIDGHGRQAENGERDGCVRTVGDHFAFEIMAARQGSPYQSTTALISSERGVGRSRDAAAARADLLDAGTRTITGSFLVRIFCAA